MNWEAIGWKGYIHELEVELEKKVKKIYFNCCVCLVMWLRGINGWVDIFIREIYWDENILQQQIYGWFTVHSGVIIFPSVPISLWKSTVL